MAKKKAAEQRELTAHEKAYYTELVLDPRFAHKECFRIEHRDQQGVLIPLVYNRAQESFYETVDTIRALNVATCLIREQLSELAEGLLGVPLDGLEHPLRPLITAIRKFGVGKVMLEVRRRGLLEQVTDSPVRLMAGKPRQQGVSTLIEALGCHKAMFGPHTAVIVMAHHDKASTNIFSMTKRFYDRWPNHPHPDDPRIPDLTVFRPEAESKARDRIDWPHDSRFVVQTAGSNTEAPRSFRFDFIHLSEYAHYPDYASVSALTGGSPKHAWIFKESTANGVGGPFYDEWQRSRYVEDIIQATIDRDAGTISKWNGYFKWFFPWFGDPAYTLPTEGWEEEHIAATLDDYEKALTARFPKITVGQLKWRRTKIANDCNHPTLSPEAFFAQEFPVDEDEMFQGSGDKTFDFRRLQLMEMRAKARTPIYLRVRDDCTVEAANSNTANLHVWEPPEPGAFYTIGADIAQGLKNKDRSAAVCLHRTDGTLAREVFLFHGLLGAVSFGDVLTMLAEWYNEAFLVPEFNGPGIATCTRIFENKYPWIYHRQTLDQVSDSMGETNTFRFGFMKSSVTKSAVIERMRQAVAEGVLELRSKALIDEMKIYQRVNGIYGPPPGEHDDCVDAASLALFGHAVGAPPVTRRLLEKRRHEAQLPQEDRDIWEAINKKSKAQHVQLKKRLGDAYFPPIRGDS